MDRRTLLQTAGVGVATALAGCVVGPSRGDGVDEEPTSTGPQKPVPGNAQFASIGEITDTTMTVGLSYPSIPREVTFELRRYSPSPSDPGTWKPYSIGDYTRPILVFEREGEVVSRTKTTYEGTRGGGYVTLDFPATEEPVGQSLIYELLLTEHTLRGQQRSLGYSPLAIRRPDTGTFIYQGERGPGTAQGFGYNDLYEYDSTETDDEQTWTIISASNSSRWLTPQMEGVENRVGEVSQYRRAWFERPWSLQYTIANDEYEFATSQNKKAYYGHTSQARFDFRNLSRLYRTFFQNNPVLSRVASELNSTAESAGLTTPLEKLRLVCDFVQWIPYRDDKSLQRDKPRVQSPTATLYEFAGDCEDKVALAGGLLYQDSLPDYQLTTYYVDDPGHVGVAVRKNIFDTEVDSVGHDEEYLYAEVTYPAPLGTIADGWSTPQIAAMAPPGHPTP